MLTGSPLMPSTQAPSHWFSWGHTRPQTAGSEESSAMTPAALRRSPSLRAWMKRGIWRLTGQPCTQRGLGQLRQRLASRVASSRL